MHNIQYRGPVTLDEETKVCPQCKGTGYEDQYEEEDCRTCWGEGEVPIDELLR